MTSDSRNDTQRNHLRAPTPKRGGSTPEAKVTAAIKRYLARIDAHVLRTGAGVAAFNGRKVSIGQAGCSDLTCCVSGRFVAIEIKSATGQTTPAQDAYLVHVRRAGGLAIVARSADDVRAALVRAFGESVVAGWEQ